MEQPANQEFITQMVNTLQQLLLGKHAAPIPEGVDTHPELAQLAELINILSSNINELNEFARQLAKGNLDVDLPGRRNYLAGTLKELHAQLTSFVWSVNQLQKGSVVERMDYRGELSDALNSLIAHMVELSAGQIQVAESSESSVNSWQYHQIALAFNHLQMMVIVAEADGRIVFSNTRVKELFGDMEMLLPDYAPPELRGLVGELVTSNTDTAFPLFREMFNEPNGRWYKITSDHITFPDGHSVFLHVIEDISEWKNSVQKLHISATTDGLTGVFNRSAGMGELEALMAEDHSESTHCVGFIDIDGLKPINDIYGHSEGDYTISTIAEVLSTTVRATDVISRIGGDEFLLIFRDCTMVEAEAVVRRMLETIDRINATHDKPYALSFSHGLVQIAPDSHISANEIVMLADKKMYERKSTKKHRAKAKLADLEAVGSGGAPARRKTDQETASAK